MYDWNYNTIKGRSYVISGLPDFAPNATVDPMHTILLWALS